MLEYDEKHDERWLVQVNQRSDGLASTASEVVLDESWKKMLPMIVSRMVDWTFLFSLESSGKAEAEGRGCSWRTNCTMPPLTTHTRSWVVLGAVTSHVSRRVLRFSCTCRTWQPYWRAARLLGSDLRSKEWWGAPSPEEHSRGRRMLQGSMCCRGSAAARQWERSANYLSNIFQILLCWCSLAHRAVGCVSAA